jgi:predicted ribosomally synthesized peptide with nif11-like leader
MSEEAIWKFYEEFQKNVELREKVIALQLNHENLEEFVAFARDAGFDFTLDELKEVNLKPVVEELSVDELEKVVGGFTNEYGNWITTSYGDCAHYSVKDYIPWGFQGKCGSCRYWYCEIPDFLLVFGPPGTCLNEANREDI